MFFLNKKSNEKARIFDINEDEERVIILCNERVDCHIVLKKIIVVRVLFFFLPRYIERCRSLIPMMLIKKNEEEGKERK